MPLIVRIDVDNPFNWYQRHKKGLNYLSLNWTTKLNWIRFGYLKYAHNLFDYLVKHDIPVTWFFTLRTLPDKDFLTGIKDVNHEIALHATQTDSWEQFKHELDIINDYLGEEVKGFSKHGSGMRKLSRTHSVEYDEERFLELAKQAGLKYFIGNGEEPSEEILKTDSVTYWPGCFWANPTFRNEERYNTSWLEKHTRISKPVFLIHPTRWYFEKKVKEIMDWVKDNIDEFSLVSK